MQIPVPRALKELWQIWDLRAVIILSLCLQLFLTLFAPLRKRTSDKRVISALWAVYLLADWAANLAVGLISSSQSDNINSGKSSAKKNVYNANVLAFWAAILLVHLGGPDTITAFALEDNDFWNRHLISLIFQSFVAIYVFYQTLPKNQLLIPTVFMFISGLIKFAERTVSLYFASLDNFRDSLRKDPDPGPNYAKLMDAYHSQNEANLPTTVDFIPQPARREKAVNKVKVGKLSDTEVVLYARHFFNTFKGLIVDLKFGPHERDQSRHFFLKREAKDAYKVITTELSFMYDVLFTKASVVYTKWGCLLRFVSFASAVTSLALFYKEGEKKFLTSDVAITYTLLLGAIALDVIAFIKFITSDWLRVLVTDLPEVPDLDNDGKTCLKKLPLLHRWWSAFVSFGLLRLLLRRWSESVSTYNLIFYCLHPHKPEKERIIKRFGLTSFFNGQKYVGHKQFRPNLWVHIFEELKMKSEISDDLETGKKLSEAKGDWVLRRNGCSELLQYVIDMDYDQSLLCWHIATDLCYYSQTDDKKIEYREFSKLLSDHMLYLVVMQPNMMLEVADIGQSRLWDTCAEGRKFFSEGSEEKNMQNLSALKLIYCPLKIVIRFIIIVLLSPILAFIGSLCVLIFLPLVHVILQPPKIEGLKKWAEKNKYFSPVMKYFCRDKESEYESLQIQKCQEILEVYTGVKPVAIKGDKSRSVLFDACILAKKLKALEENREIEDKWELMSKVWVELLSYAAIRCRPRGYAQLLRGGGELITLVWLLIAHFGIWKDFQMNEGLERAKLIVGK